MELPENMVNVMVTYLKDEVSGRKYEVTRKGFYSTLFKVFIIPHEWKAFTFNDGSIIDMPFDWNRDIRKPKDIIKWERNENVIS